MFASARSRDKPDRRSPPTLELNTPGVITVSTEGTFRRIQQ